MRKIIGLLEKGQKEARERIPGGQIFILDGLSGLC
ncbi:hypothetical protein ES703_10893 [subsurface metagenome]